jgi:hypothetical protein
MTENEKKMRNGVRNKRKNAERQENVLDFFLSKEWVDLAETFMIETEDGERKIV